MATRAELEKQLATIQAGLLDFTDVGEASYFKKTGEQKLITKEIPRYTDIYTPEFEMRKNTTFNVGSDIKTKQSGDFAFYISDPAREAERATKEKIESIEKFNQQVLAQETRIKSFLSSEKETAKEAVLQNYLSSILNPTPMRGKLNPFEYETIDVTTPEGQARWRNTANNRKTIQSIYDQQGRQTRFYNHIIKLTPAEVEEKKKTTEAIERIRFMSSPTLQKTYADIYAKTLQSSIKTMLDNERKAEAKTQKIQKKIEKLQSKLPK
jgi:hypothetical protein